MRSNQALRSRAFDALSITMELLTAVNLVSTCFATVTSEGASLPYAGDQIYLARWSNNTFLNFPGNFWEGGLNSPCGTYGRLAYQGVSCGVMVNNEPYVTKVDLSFESLPENTDRLRTKALGIDYEIVGIRYLHTLNLDGNLVTGPIQPQISVSPSLKELILSNNNITGELSSDLCALHLTCLTVANNSMSGSIPSCFRSFPCVDFQGSGLTFNPGQDCNASTNISSCAPPESVYALAPPSASGFSVGAVVALVVGVLILVALLAALLVVLHRTAEARKRDEEQRRLAQEIEANISLRHFGTLRRFSVGQLAAATNGFDEDNLVGEGGSSQVYKGTLSDGKVVAIKKMREEQKGGELEFLNEVELISRAAHCNITRCEGFCVEAGLCMLVLPFYSNGSVASRTRGKQGNPLRWEARLNIAGGAASGIAYLHTGCVPRLIHRDIKAENVLLDENDEAIVADFGLVKELNSWETHQSTAVKGTIGYIAPEYFMSGMCSDKSDVYAFGVFLLELVSGRSVLSLTTGLQDSGSLLRDWVAGVVYAGEVEALVDPELLCGGEMEVVDVMKLVQVSLLCMQPDPRDRPTMEQVAKMLQVKVAQVDWSKWKGEIGEMAKEEVMQILNTPTLWENTSTGVSITAFGAENTR